MNTIAADSKGKALYADIGSMPNVDNAKVASLLLALRRRSPSPQLGLPMLDGSRSECALGDRRRTRAAPGLMGASRAAVPVKRTDYVANGNDSYWLTNPEQPLEGYPRIIGTERTQRSLRTRLGLIMIQQRLAGDRRDEGQQVHAQASVRRLVFQNRHYAGRAVARQLVAYCNAHPTMTGTGGPVDVSAACPALADWDLKVNLDSRGALLFVRFMDKFGNAASGSPPRSTSPTRSTRPFGLNTVDRDARAGASPTRSPTCQAANIPLDAAYGDFHTEPRGAERIPIHGGEGGQGVFNAISDVFDGRRGYDDVTAGLELRHGDPLPRARGARRTARSSPTRCRRTRTPSTTPTRRGCTRRSSGSTRRSAPSEVERTAESVKTIRTR